VSRRSATIVFLGVWALFGVNTWSSSQGAPSRVMRKDHAERLGKVLGEAVLSTSGHDPPVFEDALPQIDPSYVTSSTPWYTTPDDTSTPPNRPQRPKPPKRPARSMKLIIGRISAWLCTVLYLTSRLPQIWKNFVRKSVEGLSIMLFVAAFLGNFFYVLSILTNPVLNAPEEVRMEYIRETMPYLLGSGGTLLFDITIVSQSFIYRGQRPKPTRAASVGVYTGSIRPRSLARRSVIGEEERLLATVSPERSATIGRRSRSRIGYGTVQSTSAV